MGAANFAHVDESLAFCQVIRKASANVCRQVFPCRTGEIREAIIDTVRTEFVRVGLAILRDNPFEREAISFRTHS